MFPLSRLDIQLGNMERAKVEQFVVSLSPLALSKPVFHLAASLLFCRDEAGSRQPRLDLSSHLGEVQVAGGRERNQFEKREERRLQKGGRSREEGKGGRQEWLGEITKR